MPHRLPQRRAIVRIAIEAQADLVRIWDNACLGLYLTDAFFTGRPRTTDEIAAHCGISVATAKRRLEPLINIGRVETAMSGRTTVYQASFATAVKTADTLLGLTGMSSPGAMTRAQIARLSR